MSAFTAMSNMNAKRHKRTSRRPPCWVVAVDGGPIEGESLADLKAMEANLLEQGMKLRIVVFDERPTPLMALIGYPLQQFGPREEQLERVYAAAKAGIPAELVSHMGPLQ